MKKANINLIIDALLLLSVSAIAGIGLLIKFVLIPGHLRWDIYGRNVELFLWGLDRHQWGTIHLVIGYVFLVFLIIHVVLHWATVVCIYRRMIRNPFARWTIALILLYLTILFIIFPYFAKPEIQEGGHRRLTSYSNKSVITQPPDQRTTHFAAFWPMQL